MSTGPPIPNGLVNTGKYTLYGYGSGVTVGVSVLVNCGVFVFVGASVGHGVFVFVGALVGMIVAIGVLVTVGVCVSNGVIVLPIVAVGVGVAVFVGVFVAVFVIVGVYVVVGQLGPLHISHSRHITSMDVYDIGLMIMLSPSHSSIVWLFGGMMTVSALLRAPARSTRITRIASAKNKAVKNILILVDLLIFILLLLLF